VGKGYLRVKTVTANGADIVRGASITVKDESGNILYELTTGELGYAQDMALDAPDMSYMENPNPSVTPFNLYRLDIRAYGYTSMAYEGIMIFDATTSILVIDLTPAVLGQENAVNHISVESHKLYNTETPQQVLEPGMEILPRILPDVTIPSNIRVHLGRRETPSQIVSVPFIDYIKNVTSHEIFDHWPEQTIIANVYCIVSLTLNRIFTEFYRKQGFNFDITSTTHLDQKYVHGGIIGSRISAVVDRIFNHYLAIIGHKEPFLALYNDGTTVNIPGRLSQWGSFFDGQAGMQAWQIIRKYYSQGLELRICDNFDGILESYPGRTLRQGDSGDAVRTMQLYLNGVLGFYTNVIINPVNGVFGASTRNAVLVAQQAWGLPQTGEIDRRTWYEISRRFAIRRAIWEMHSQGIRIGIGTVPPTQIVRLGDPVNPGNTAISSLIVKLQFLLDFILMYYPQIPFVPQTGRFDQLTNTGVRAFQALFGLAVDGIVGPITWRTLYNVYWGIMENAPIPQPPTQPPPTEIPPFPGNLSVGSSGANVRLVQEAINKIAPNHPGRLWILTVDGGFGNMTRDAIFTFQSIFGLPITGVVDQITWDRLMQEAFGAAPPLPPLPPPTGIPPFPGNLSVGSSGANVRLVQEAINKIAPNHPGRLWILTVDGAFGNMTRDAVFAFQSIFGLPITGVVGQVTWDRLMQEAFGTSPPSPPPTGIPPFPGNLSVGSSGANVRLVQESINRIAPNHPGRLWILTVDGAFGNMTRDAIFSFQSIFGLPITGVVGQVTWDRLMQEAANTGRSFGTSLYPDSSISGNETVERMMHLLLVNKMLR